MPNPRWVFNFHSTPHGETESRIINFMDNIDTFLCDKSMNHFNFSDYDVGESSELIPFKPLQQNMWGWALRAI